MNAADIHFSQVNQSAKNVFPCFIQPSSQNVSGENNLASIGHINQCLTDVDKKSTSIDHIRFVTEHWKYSVSWKDVIEYVLLGRVSLVVQITILVPQSQRKDDSPQLASFDLQSMCGFFSMHSNSSENQTEDNVCE